MSLETLLYTELVAVCPRVFPDVAPTTTPRPYITCQQIGGESPQFIGRELTSKRNALVQINVWATTRNESMTLMLAVESRLTLATTIQASPSGAMHADIDDDTDLRTAIQDFIIWSDR